MSEIRVMPLPKVTGIWRHDCSKYPEEIRVPMSDGKVIRYHIDVKQPEPVFKDKLDKFTKTCGGGHTPRTNEH